LTPPGLNSGPSLLEGQADARERRVELVGRHHPRALRRVVQVGIALPEPLEDDEVVGVPEQDRRVVDLPEVRDLVLEALGVEAVLARRLEDVVGLRAVAADAALGATLLERHDAAVVAEHHAERRRAALDRLHLEHGRHLLAFVGRRLGGFGLRRLGLGPGHGDRLGGGLGHLVGALRATTDRGSA
jgi:hypothetical protein